MNLTEYLLDFEEVLASTFSAIFLNCTIMRNYFHFKLANLRKLQKIGLSHLRSEVSTDLSVI
jgi:hypothetical protein